MVNIVIKESDTLFQRGADLFLGDFFSQHNTTVDFNLTLRQKAFSLADVIVAGIMSGQECFICLP